MPTSNLCPTSPGQTRKIASAAAVMGLAVALGAFGAHGLKATLAAHGRMDDWKTAVLYHLVHGTALFALAIWAHLDPAAAKSRSIIAVGRLWLIGIFCFSGSLYALGLGTPARWIWPVTPLGGFCLLAGWTVLAIATWRSEGRDSRSG